MFLLNVSVLLLLNKLRLFEKILSEIYRKGHF